jgi:hypothetical protein
MTKNKRFSFLVLEKTIAAKGVRLHSPSVPANVLLASAFPEPRANPDALLSDTRLLTR